MAFLRMPILVTTILLCPVICRIIGGGDEITWTYVLLSVLVVLPITHLLCCIRNKATFLIILALLLMISLCESFMSLISTNYVAAGNIISTFNTNLTESDGFVKANGWAILAVLPMIVLYVLASKYWNLSLTRKRYHLIIALLSVCISGGYITDKYLMRENKSISVAHTMQEEVLRKTPYNFIHQVIRIIAYYDAKQYIPQADSFVFGASRDSIPAENEIYVLTIGESLTYEHFSLNGTYEHETTPLLAATPNVQLMHNYYASAPMTIFSVPQILTRGTADDFTRVYKEKTIVQAFTESGFKSVVIAHKNNMLGTDPYLSRGAERILIDHDAQMPLLLDSLARIHPKLFVVGHFWGSHYPYTYPEEYNVFHPNERDTKKDIVRQHYVNGYDNSIRYTDWVLHRIIQTLDRPNTQSVFMFLSDHGELFTDKGALHSTTYNPPVGEYHVPLLVWSSTPWQEANMAKQTALESHQNAPINTDNVFYSVCDMASITIPSDAELLPQMSIFSADLQPHPRYCMRSDGGSYIELD